MGMEEEQELCNEKLKHSADDTHQNQSKLSHKKWKALHRKEKRKLRRQEEARQRQEEINEEEEKKQNSPSHLVRLKEVEENEILREQREEAERAYLTKVWEEKERLAQEEWKLKKEREIKEKEKRIEIEKKIKEEWEERQRKEKEEEELKGKKKEKQEELLKEATANENKIETWHNPILTRLPGKERDPCMFFSKTGSCRFGDRCSRGHPEPEASNTLLFASMYNHFELEQGLKDDLDTTDVALEYEDGELYQNFQDFYNDIVPEFKNYGRVTQVKVCSNYEPHLRGNVYVQYKSENSAQEAFMNLNGRFYGGKQLSCQFVEIKKWKSAICGLYGSGRCPKGRNCNFLHVFKNPRNEFWDADMDTNHERMKTRRRRSRSRSWSRKHRSRRARRSRSRSYDSHRQHSTKYSRSRSRSRERSHVRPGRRRNRSRSRSRSRDLLKSRSKRDRQRRSRSWSQERSNGRSKKSEKCERGSRSRSRSQSRSRRQSKRERRSRSRSRPDSQCPLSMSDEETLDNLDLEDGRKFEPVTSVNGVDKCENNTNKNHLRKSNSPESSAKKKHKKHKKHKHKKKSYLESSDIE